MFGLFAGAGGVGGRQERRRQFALGPSQIANLPGNFPMPRACARRAPAPRETRTRGSPTRARLRLRNAMRRLVPPADDAPRVTFVGHSSCARSTPSRPNRSILAGPPDAGRPGAGFAAQADCPGAGRICRGLTTTRPRRDFARRRRRRREPQAALAQRAQQKEDDVRFANHASRRRSPSRRWSKRRARGAARPSRAPTHAPEARPAARVRAARARRSRRGLGALGSARDARDAACRTRPGSRATTRRRASWSRGAARPRVASRRRRRPPCASARERRPGCRRGGAQGRRSGARGSIGGARAPRGRADTDVRALGEPSMEMRGRGGGERRRSTRPMACAQVDARRERGAEPRGRSEGRRGADRQPHQRWSSLSSAKRLDTLSRDCAADARGGGRARRRLVQAPAVEKRTSARGAPARAALARAATRARAQRHRGARTVAREEQLAIERSRQSRVRGGSRASWRVWKTTSSARTSADAKV